MSNRTVRSLPLPILVLAAAITACAQLPSLTEQGQPASPPEQAQLPNPASVHCEDRGGALRIRTGQDGGQLGVCVFPDGSECEEWAYYRGECAPQGADAMATDVAPTAAPPSEFTAATDLPAPPPIDPSEYQGWWTYTHPDCGFSILLPPDWVAIETAAADDPLLGGHLLNLQPEPDGEVNLRMTFRRVGEQVLLWPTGVGSGEFIPAGDLPIADTAARRFLFVCPTGEVQSVWYHGPGDSPNLQLGALEFGFLFSWTEAYCRPDHSLDVKIQRVSDMIVASLDMP